MATATRRKGRGGSRQVSLRMPLDVVRELEEYVDRMEIPLSAAIAQGVKEWLRMQLHPGIDFRWTPTGRRAHVTGTGLSVWELHHIWLDHKEDVRWMCRNYPGLKPAQITAAVRYAKTYPKEIPTGWGEPPKGIPVVRV